MISQIMNNNIKNRIRIEVNNTRKNYNNNVTSIVNFKNNILQKQYKKIRKTKVTILYHNIMDKNINDKITISGSNLKQQDKHHNNIVTNIVLVLAQKHKNVTNSSIKITQTIFINNI